MDAKRKEVGPWEPMEGEAGSALTLDKIVPNRMDTYAATVYPFGGGFRWAVHDGSRSSGWRTTLGAAMSEADARLGAGAPPVEGSGAGSAVWTRRWGAA